MPSNNPKRRKLDVLDVIEPQIQRNIIRPEVAWNEEMHAFYNDPWGAEMDLVNEEPIEWSELRQPPKTNTKCSMCGNGGHDRTSCPNACCLTCGEKTSTFQDECAKCLAWTSAVCEICGYRGHMKNDCPNQWKRYHSTIDTASGLEYSMLENRSNFQFNWDVNGKAHGFYERFLNATK